MVRKIIIHIIFSLLLCTSCTKEGKSFVSDNDTKDYRIYDYYEDQYGNRGIVAAIINEKEGKKHLSYKIVLSLDETIATWGPIGVEVYKPIEGFNKGYPHGVFFGLEVNKMVADMNSEGFPAFNWCLQKNGPEKVLHSSSWLLPTIAELDDIFNGGKNVEELNHHILKYGGTPVTTIEDQSPHCYWTCVEDLDGVIQFSDDIQSTCDHDPGMRAIPCTSGIKFYTDKTNWHKNIEYRVRAIKYICFDAVLD